MRYSKQRQLVYEAVASTDTHPTANWVYERVRTVLPNISLGTVYRNLAELCQCGKVKKVTAFGDTEHYDADISKHTHLVCKCCGKIMDAPYTNVVVDSRQFEVDNIEVTVYGKCCNCR